MSELVKRFLKLLEVKPISHGTKKVVKQSKGLTIRKATNEERKKTQIIKSWAEYKANQQRLRTTTIESMVLEVIKNALEYGESLEININDTDRTISFANKVRDDLYDALTFPELIDQLKTHSSTTNKNFNEGLTTLLLTKFKLRVKDLCIVSIYTGSERGKLGDGYFQDRSGVESSHLYYPDEEELLLCKEYPILEDQLWSVEIFTDETEQVLEKKLNEEIEYFKGEIEQLKSGTLSFSNRRYKNLEEAIDGREAEISFRVTHLEMMEDFHTKLNNAIYEVINRFYVRSDFEIKINGAKYDPNAKHSGDEPNYEIIEKIYNGDLGKRSSPSWRGINYSLWNTEYRQKYIRHHLKLARSSSERVYIIWKLNAEGCFHIVENGQFDNKKVYGIVILDDNWHFSGKSREELRKQVIGVIDEKIEDIVKKHSKDIRLEEKLDNYADYKSDFLNYFSRVLNVPKRIVKKVFFNPEDDNIKQIIKEKHPKEEDRKRRWQWEAFLIKVTNWLHTYRETFKYNHLEVEALMNITDKTERENLERGEVMLFHHPKGYSARMLESDEFKEITKSLEINFKHLFPNKIIGDWIGLGESSIARLGDVKIGVPVLAVDPEKYENRNEVIYSENKEYVLYPSKSADRIVDLNFVNLEEVMNRLKTKIQQMDILKKYDLNEELREEIKEREKEKEEKKKEKEKKEKEIEEKKKEIEEEKDINKKLELKREKEKLEEEKGDLAEEIVRKELEIIEYLENESEDLKEKMEKWREYFKKQEAEAEEYLDSWDYTENETGRKINSKVEEGYKKIDEILEEIENLDDYISDLRYNYDEMKYYLDVSDSLVEKYEKKNETLREDIINPKKNNIQSRIFVLQSIKGQIDKVKRVEESEEKKEEKKLSKVDHPDVFGKEYIVGEIIDEDEKIPFLFNSEKEYKQWERWVELGRPNISDLGEMNEYYEYEGEKFKLNSKPSFGVVKGFRRYKACAEAIKMIEDIAEIKHPLHLVWYYDGNSDEEGWYLRGA